MESNEIERILNSGDEVDLLSSMFDLIGYKEMASILEDSKTDPDQLRFKIEEQIKWLLEGKSKIVLLGDTKNTALVKNIVLSCAKGYDEDGYPTLIINDGNLFKMEKDTPIGITLEYEEDEVRDKDYEKLIIYKLIK